MTIPKHVAIIMDGNGRWAQIHGKERLYGHKVGAESVREVVKSAAEAGVAYLSLFAFSSENWNRPKEEVNGLMALLMEALNAETPNLIKNNVKLRSIGALSDLPLSVQECFGRAVKETAGCSGLTVVLAISYSGTWDIVQAANRYVEERLAHTIEPHVLDAPLFERYLSTAGIPPPDLLIRTSGEERISNYMLWQLAYTELYFTPTLWPDFRREDFEKALAEYGRRERRFGIIK